MKLLTFATVGLTLLILGQPVEASKLKFIKHQYVYVNRNWRNTPGKFTDYKSSFRRQWVVAKYDHFDSSRNRHVVKIGSRSCDYQDYARYIQSFKNGDPIKLWHRPMGKESWV